MVGSPGWNLTDRQEDTSSYSPPITQLTDETRLAWSFFDASLHKQTRCEKFLVRVGCLIVQNQSYKFTLNDAFDLVLTVLHKTCQCLARKLLQLAQCFLTLVLLRKCP